MTSTPWTSMKRWQDAVNVAGGLFLSISPWLLGFADDGRALVVTVVLGSALLAAALGAFTLPQAWEKGDEILVGLAAVGSPWLIGQQSNAPFRNSTVVVGALAILMAGLSMFADWRSRMRGAREGEASISSLPGRKTCQR